MCPVTLLGDLNVPPEMSGALQAAVSTGRWIDAALECATARACEPANNCFVRETSVGSRIDVAWFNNVAAAALIACNTISDTGFPTHVPLVAEVQLARYEQFVDIARRPLAIPLGWEDPKPEKELQLSSEFAERIVAASASLWNAAMRAVDVEALWGIFNSDAEQYLIQRAEGCTTALVQKYEGRGTLTVQKRRAQVAPQRDCTGAAGIRVRRLLPMTRRFEDLIR